jgi:hypothetical protein
MTRNAFEKQRRIKVSQKPNTKPTHLVEFYLKFF